MSTKHAHLESSILRALTEIIRTEVKDPNVDFVTLTALKLTNDLSFLTIYYTNLDENKKPSVHKALERSKPFIRTMLGKKVRMRKLPQLIFKYDDSLAYGNKIEQGLKEVLKDDE
jgi:ribosome-binding factor A